MRVPSGVKKGAKLAPPRCVIWCWPLAVGREERAAVVARGVRQPADVGAVDVHRVELEIAILERREDNCLAVGRERSLGGVDAVAREALGAAAIGIGGVDVVLVEPPHVPLRWVGLPGARAVGRARGRVEDFRVVREEVAARRLAGAVGDAAQRGAVGVHDVFPIAPSIVARALEDQLLAIGAEVRLGVFATVRELADVGEVWLCGAQ